MKQVVQSNLNPRRHMGLWLIALGAAMWGLDGVFISSLLHHLTSSEIVFCEHTLLLLFAIPILVWKRHEFRVLDIKDWLAILFIAWGGSALASVFFTQAFVYGNVNTVLILQKLQPVFAVAIAAVVLRERLSRAFIPIFGIALIGTYLLTFGFRIPHSGASHAAMYGAILALGAAFLWGGSTVMGRRLVGKLSFSTVTALRFAVAFPLLGVLVLTETTHGAGLGVRLLHVGPILNLLFQTLFPSLLSLLLYYKGLQGTKASYATIAELAFPATGLLLNWLVLKQSLTFGQAVGFALVWVAVSILSLQREQPATLEQMAA